ncbi:hypothetical protein JTE90_011667 [Oedothorax gibbosus]|uniref:Uncharacterized protein n=1 Tax=Oedothorax gibbosus TaxID=931172 RepID=A0AAV6TH89_9ARAC|nr:hypothetical protein JTE90_011667 [Oedothorax gibbosus]
MAAEVSFTKKRAGGRMSALQKGLTVRRLPPPTAPSNYLQWRPPRTTLPPARGQAPSAKVTSWVGERCQGQQNGGKTQGGKILTFSRTPQNSPTAIRKN